MAGERRIAVSRLNKLYGIKTCGSLNNLEVAKSLVRSGLFKADIPETKKEAKKVIRGFAEYVRQGHTGDYGLPVKSSPPKKKRVTKSQEFLKSWEWAELRYKTLKKYGAVCMCCGAHASKNVRIHVDHIKPRSKFPELALDPDNLQVLCAMCNKGKSNWDTTDWRPDTMDEQEKTFQRMLAYQATMVQ